MIPMLQEFHSLPDVLCVTIVTKGCLATFRMQTCTAFTL